MFVDQSALAAAFVAASTLPVVSGIKKPWPLQIVESIFPDVHSAQKS